VEDRGEARGFGWYLLTSALVSMTLSLGAYKYYGQRADQESLWPFLAAIGFSIVPFFLAYRFYFFDRQLAARLESSKKGKAQRPGLGDRLGAWVEHDIKTAMGGQVEEQPPVESWSNDLRLERSIFVT